MLVVIAGGDAYERAERRHALVAGAEELDRRTITVEEMASIAGTMTLTGEPRAFFMRGALSKVSDSTDAGGGDDFRDAVLDIAEGLVASPHLFIFEEEKALTKAPLERLKKAGAQLELLTTAGKKEKFNIFALADALQRRDRKNLWLLLMQAFRQGLTPENIAGVLSWKARSMLSSARSPRDRELLEKTSRDIICMYHDAHRGMGDLALVLERFSLTL